MWKGSGTSGKGGRERERPFGRHLSAVRPLAAAGRGAPESARPAPAGTKSAGRCPPQREHPRGLRRGAGALVSWRWQRKCSPFFLRPRGFKGGLQFLVPRFSPWLLPRLWFRTQRDGPGSGPRKPGFRLQASLYLGQPGRPRPSPKRMTTERRLGGDRVCLGFWRRSWSPPLPPQAANLLHRRHPGLCRGAQAPPPPIYPSSPRAAPLHPTLSPFRRKPAGGVGWGLGDHKGETSRIPESHRCPPPAFTFQRCVTLGKASTFSASVSSCAKCQQ